MNANHHPLVVIVTTRDGIREKVKDKLRDVSAKWKIRLNGKLRPEDVVFTWMDGEKWASWLKGMYGIKQNQGEDGVNIVIANHAVSFFFCFFGVIVLDRHKLD